MTTKINIIYFLFLVFCFFSCSKQKTSSPENTTILSVDLEKRNCVSIFDIFKKLEIIPLETTDASLIKSVGKIEYFDQKYYIFDRELSRIFCFDKEGNYIGNIGQIGNGPEEYISIQDFLIDRNRNKIIILSPFNGSLYFYDLSTGKLTDKIQLKTGPVHHQQFAMLNDDIFVFLSASLERENKLSLFSIKENEYINSFHKENGVQNIFSNEAFYTFNNEVFFSNPFDNKIYAITELGEKVSYNWDFGSMNMNLKNFNLPADFNDRMRKLFDMMRDSQLKSVCDIHFQTDEYYYAHSLRNLDHTLHVFFYKKTGKTHVFEKFSEDIFFFPVYWHKDFVISTSSFHGKHAVDTTILDEENDEKLKRIREDDNPFIIKYLLK